MGQDEIMMTTNRWKLAQTHEKRFWEAAAERIAARDAHGLSWYKWRAENLLEMVKRAFPTGPPSFADGRVLEVGSGPVGVVAFLEAAERIAIDPLSDFYATQPALIEHRNPQVKYQAARGEELGLADGSLDLVIIENVIDHVEDADAVMKEIHRVLKPGGILFLTVNLHPAWGALLHRLASTLRIDRCHPHTFTIRRIERFLAEHGYEILYREWQDCRECRRKDLASPAVKDKLKALSGLSEFLFTSVSLK